MTNEEKSEIVDYKLDELRKLLNLVDVANEVAGQFPDDEDVSKVVNDTHNKRFLGIHMAIVDILGVYGECTDFELIDLMERNFEASGKSEEVDRDVEAYFGKLDSQRKKKILYKRRDNDE